MFFLCFFFHLIFAFVLFFNKRLKYFLSILVFLPIALIYLKKEPTYDLKFYYDYFEAGWDYLEYGFRYLILILNKALLANPFLIHFAYQLISLVLIFISSKKLFFEKNIKKTNLYLFLPVTVISLYTLFYLLGSQNALRQYFAFIISFIGFLFLLENQKFKSFVFFALSLFFHKVILLYLPLYFLIKIFKNQKLLIYVFSFIGGLCFYLILITVLSEFYSVNFYISYQDQAAFQEKRSGILKVILVSLSILVTTIIFKTCEEYDRKSKIIVEIQNDPILLCINFCSSWFL